MHYSYQGSFGAQGYASCDARNVYQHGPRRADKHWSFRSAERFQGSKGKGKGKPSVEKFRSDRSGRLIHTFDDFTTFRAGAPLVDPIRETQFIASFNWVDPAGPVAEHPGKGSKGQQGAPKLVTPGWPARYKTLRDKTQLERDGVEFCDENHFRNPAFPSDSMFVVSKLHGVDPVEVADVLTDRNNLRKILKWLRDGKRGEEFEFFVDRIARESPDDCLLLTRHELMPDVQDCSSGFGHSFEEAVTEKVKDDKTIISHRRITTSKVGDLRIMVRSEVDAVQTEPFELADDNFPNFSQAEASDVLYCRAGPTLPRDAKVVELKTKRADRVDEFDWLDVYFQMALVGIDVLAVGWHSFGEIQKVEEFTLAEVLERAQPALKKVGGVERLLGGLHEVLLIIKRAAQHNDRLLVVFDGVKLEIRERSGPSRVPDSALP